MAVHKTSAEKKVMQATAKEPHVLSSGGGAGAAEVVVPVAVGLVGSAAVVVDEVVS